MGTVPHTPDPAQGAIIDAKGGGNALIYMPDENEDMRAELVAFTGQQLADWIAYLRQYGVQVGRVQTDTPYPATPAGPGVSAWGTWEVDPDGFFTAAILGAKLFQPVKVRFGAMIQEVHVFIDPANEARSGAFPEFLPSFRLLRISSIGGVTVVGATDDISPSVNGYEAPHALTLTGLTEVYNGPSDSYRIEITTESGANSFAGTRYLSSVVTYTGGPVDPG